MSFQGHLSTKLLSRFKSFENGFCASVAYRSRGPLGQMAALLNVAVVGGGIMGAAIANAASRVGAKVSREGGCGGQWGRLALTGFATVAPRRVQSGR